MLALKDETLEQPYLDRLPEKKKAHFHQIGDFLPEWGRLDR